MSQEKAKTLREPQDEIEMLDMVFEYLNPIVHTSLDKIERIFKWTLDFNQKLRLRNLLINSGCIVYKSTDEGDIEFKLKEKEYREIKAVGSYSKWEEIERYKAVLKRQQDKQKPKENGLQTGNKPIQSSTRKSDKVFHTETPLPITLENPENNSPAKEDIPKWKTKAFWIEDTIKKIYGYAIAGAIILATALYSKYTTPKSQKVTAPQLTKPQSHLEPKKVQKDTARP